MLQAQALGMQSSVVTGTLAQLPVSMWDIPRPGTIHN